MVAGNPFLYKRPSCASTPRSSASSSTCNDICDYLFGDPGTIHCCTVRRRERASSRRSSTFSSPSGMNTILLEAYTDCPDATAPALSRPPDAGLRDPEPARRVVVDCSRATITVYRADPSPATLVATDGSYLIELPDGRSRSSGSRRRVRRRRAASAPGPRTRARRAATRPSRSRRR
jgi:hypothetical protein